MILLVFLFRFFSNPNPTFQQVVLYPFSSINSWKKERIKRNRLIGMSGDYSDSWLTYRMFHNPYPISWLPYNFHLGQARMFLKAPRSPLSQWVARAEKSRRENSIYIHRNKYFFIINISIYQAIIFEMPQHFSIHLSIYNHCIFILRMPSIYSHIYLLIHL